MEKHSCVDRTEDNLVIFECPTCGYIRVVNKDDHTMKVVDQGDIKALHSGSTDMITFNLGI